MDISSKITITLSENDVKSIIADFLTKKYHRVAARDIKLVVADRWVGFGLNEHREPYFKECIAVAKGE